MFAEVGLCAVGITSWRVICIGVLAIETTRDEIALSRCQSDCTAQEMACCPRFRHRCLLLTPLARCITIWCTVPSCGLCIQLGCTHASLAGPGIQPVIHISAHTSIQHQHQHHMRLCAGRLSSPPAPPPSVPSASKTPRTAHGLSPSALGAAIGVPLGVSVLVAVAAALLVTHQRRWRKQASEYGKSYNTCSSGSQPGASALRPCSAHGSSEADRKMVAIELGKDEDEDYDRRGAYDDTLTNSSAFSPTDTHQSEHKGRSKRHHRHHWHKGKKGRSSRAGRHDGLAPSGATSGCGEGGLDVWDMATDLVLGQTTVPPGTWVDLDAAVQVSGGWFVCSFVCLFVCLYDLWGLAQGKESVCLSVQW